MAVATEEQELKTLVTAREPEGPVRSGDPGSQADQALKDALTAIVIAWALLFLLWFSLRRHNV